MRTNVQFAKLRPNAKTPTRGSSYAAGYDLYACMNLESYTLHPGETFKIGTGISVTPPKGYFGAIFARSGLATKQGLRPANCVGVCDEDYTGEYIIAVHNDSNHAQVIHDGDRIAQLIFLPYLDVEFEEVETLEETTRGSGGFGSTGKA